MNPKLAALRERIGKPVAEYLATTTFFFIAAVATAIVTILFGQFAGMLAVLAAAATWGGALAISVLFFGGYEAAHCNPAVTLGMVVGGRTPWKMGAAYVVAQLAGSITGLWFASFLVNYTFSRDYASQFIVKPVHGYKLLVVMGLEASMAGCLTLAVLIVTRDTFKYKSIDWLVIGGALAGAILFIAIYTGGAINPVRALAPWLLAPPKNGLIDTLLAFVFATSVGGIVAGLVFQLLPTSPPPAE